MGIYFDPDGAFENFKGLVNKKYYIDKSSILCDFNNRLEGADDRFVCITRPRRFGKTSLEDMIISYYCKEFDPRIFLIS